MSSKQTKKNISKKFKTKRKWSSISSDKFIGNLNKYLILETHENFDGKIEYMYHQKLVRKFMSSDSPYRGLLLYHGLGSGKTCSSVLISEANRSLRKTVVFLPTSLEENFRIEIGKCSDYDILDRPNMYWVHIKRNNKNDKFLREIFNEYIFTKLNQLDLIDKLWISVDDDSLAKIDYSELKKLKDLSNEEKQTILDQNRKIKLCQYKIEHYDGLTRERIRDIERNNELDDSLIIVDEAHNLGSMMKNQKIFDTQEKGSIRGRLIYELFMKSKNTRFIFLTGTPVISNPIELAYIYNILRGPMDIFKIPLDIMQNDFDDEFIQKIVTEYKYFDFFKVYKTYIEVTKVPCGFYKTVDNYLKFESNSPTNHSEWLIHVMKYFKKFNINIDIRDIVTSKNCCFNVPTYENINDTSFLDTFTNDNESSSNMFKRRITGLTSFYNGNANDKKEFPKVVNHPIIEVPMSLSQYDQYQLVRKKEINQEKKNKLRRINDDNYTETFRTNSRSICNFIFPTQILNSSHETKFVSNEDSGDEITENDKHFDKDLISQFSHFINTTIETKHNQKEKNEFMKIMKNLSPKYNLIEEQISKNIGTSVVYSNFKNNAGLYAFSCILKFHGWNMLTLQLINKKEDRWLIKNSNENSNTKTFAIYDSTDSEGRSQEIIRKIFNNDLRNIPKSVREQLSNNNNLYGKLINTLLITPKGAEGITLKNVRQLHIVEHYWSYVRTEQVIGRAVRYKSHEELPEIDRVVNIHKYVTVIDDKLDKFLMESSEYKTDYSVIKDYDNLKTSDQFVLEISKKKYVLINKYLDMVKESSIDCNLHYNNKCMSENLLDDEFHPNFGKHLKNIEIKDKEPKNYLQNLEIKYLKKKWLPLSLQGKTVFIDKKSNDIYDYDSINSRQPKLLGRLLESQKRFINAPK